MEVFVTIVAGVTVFVLGQTVLKLVIEPIQKLREAIAEVAFHLANDDPVIHNEGTVSKEQSEAVSVNFTQLGARLVSSRQLVPFYDQLRKVFALPNKESIGKAAQRLTQIPNHMYGDHPTKHERLDLYRIEVCELLQLRDPINKGISKQELVDAIRGTQHS